MQKINKQKTQNIFPGLIRKKPTSFEQAYISKYPAIMQAKLTDRNSFQYIAKLAPTYDKVKKSVIDWNQSNQLQEQQKILNSFDLSLINLENKNNMILNSEYSSNNEKQKEEEKIKGPSIKFI